MAAKKVRNGISENARHYTADELRFIKRCFKRNGLQWVKKYRDAMSLRTDWDRMEKCQIEYMVERIISSDGTMRLTCK